MIVHEQIGLRENIAAVAGAIEKYRGLGLTITAEAMGEVERKLGIIAEQARAVCASRDALVDELLAEQRLGDVSGHRFELPAQAERRGAPSRRVAWVRDEIVQVAGAIARPGLRPTETAHWLRYLANHLYAVGEEVEAMEPVPVRPAPTMTPRSAGRALLRLVSRNEGVRS